MVKGSLDDMTDQIFQEENPKGDAIKSLINVAPQEKGKPSEIETKTDLDEEFINVHTLSDFMSDVLEMNSETFKTKCVLSMLVNKRERKLLSKGRKSRMEIVEIARTPDQMNMMGDINTPNDNFIKRMFKSKKDRV